MLRAEHHFIPTNNNMACKLSALTVLHDRGQNIGRKGVEQSGGGACGSTHPAWGSQQQTNLWYRVEYLIAVLASLALCAHLGVSSHVGVPDTCTLRCRYDLPHGPCCTKQSIYNFTVIYHECPECIRSFEEPYDFVERTKSHVFYRQSEIRGLISFA